MTAVEMLIPTLELDDMEIGTSEVEVTSEGGPATPETETIGKVVNELVSKISCDGFTTNTDIIILEDDLPLKKANSTSNYDLDENGTLSSENKENICRQIKRMSRKDLEDLVLLKVVEGIVKHSEAGKIRTRVQELQVQKDKMFHRVGHLQKQIQELSKAIKLLLDSHNRDPNNLDPNKKRPPPIKFYRSVGLQVSIEPSFRNGITKVVHLDPPKNGITTVNGTVNGVYATPNNPQTLKRSIKNEGSKHKVSNNARVSRGSVSNGQHITSPLKNIAPAPAAISISSVNINKTISTPTVVDLTDDSGSSPLPTSNVVTASNGVQYRIMNTQGPGVQYIPGGYQFVTSASGQVRPIILQAQNATGGTAQPQRAVQTVMLRNISPKTSIATTPSSSNVQQTRPSSANSNKSRPLQTNATNQDSKNPRASTATMIRAPSSQSSTKKVLLPALPASPVVSVPQGRPLKDLPPRPGLTLTEQSEGIVLSWTMKLTSQHAEIASYQIFACQESLATSPGKISHWKKVGDVKALPLPMACTLSQFTQGNRYFFIVRGVDGHGRAGPFCEPGPITLQRKS